MDPAKTKSSAAPAKSTASAAAKHYLDAAHGTVELKSWSTLDEDLALYEEFGAVKGKEFIKDPRFDLDRHIGVYRLQNDQVIWVTPAGASKADVDKKHMYALSHTALGKHPQLAPLVKQKPPPSKFGSLPLPDALFKADTRVNPRAKSDGAAAAKRDEASAVYDDDDDTVHHEAIIPSGDALIEAASKRMASRLAKLEAVATAGEQGSLSPFAVEQIASLQKAAEKSGAAAKTPAQFAAVLAAAQLQQVLDADHPPAHRKLLKKLPNAFEGLKAVDDDVWTKRVSEETERGFRWADVVALAVQTAAQMSTVLLQKFDAALINSERSARDHLVAQAAATQRIRDLEQQVKSLQSELASACAQSAAKQRPKLRGPDDDDEEMESKPQKNKNIKPKQKQALRGPDDDDEEITAKPRKTKKSERKTPAAIRGADDDSSESELEDDVKHRGKKQRKPDDDDDEPLTSVADVPTPSRASNRPSGLIYACN